MVTVREILRLPVLRGARVVAGRRVVSAPVRWCHVAEVLDIARLLSGGELLLTTGLALDVAPERQAAYIEDLRQCGVAGLMLELQRQFRAAPPAMVAAADRVGLPLITLPYDTPFVQVTEAVHTLVLARRQPGHEPPAREQRAEARLLADLWAGRITRAEELRRRLEEVGRTLPDGYWLGVLVADGAAAPEAVRAAAAAELGPRQWILQPAGEEGRLLAFAPDPAALAGSLRALALRLEPVAAGVGRCAASPQAAAVSLAEARQTMRLRRSRPALDPLFAETGIYRLALGSGSAEAEQFVRDWLGPLLQYDRLHKTELCRTLRLLLDHGLVAAAARRLHLTRQALYHRQQRIADVLGRDLADPEVRVALAVALRFWEAQSERQAAPAP